MQKHVQPCPLARAGTGVVDDRIAGPGFVPFVQVVQGGGDDGGGEDGLGVKAEGAWLGVSLSGPDDRVGPAMLRDLGPVCAAWDACAAVLGSDATLRTGVTINQARGL